MATRDVGSGHGGRRALDHNIPLIPFIDFLLCLVAFLLVTAVWSQMARLRVDAQVPGLSSVDGDKPDSVRELHVEASGDRSFKLSWNENGTVINTTSVDKKRGNVGNDGDYGYPDLAAKVLSEWHTSGQHRAAVDKKLDRAVLHIDNSAPFSDIAAIVDALQATKRTVSAGSKAETIPAFNVAFAVN